MSHTTVNQALRGPKVPTWPVVAKVVEALDGDIEAMRALWIETREPVGAGIQPGESEIRVFVSYARIDDEATYGRISKLIQDIANTYQSITGKTVGVFLDTDSIKPGDDWRDRIRLGLSYSSVFLAFISPAYLRSAACREELSEFLAFLTSSSVERLVIPLLYARKERIESSFTNDDLWLKIAQRQYEDIANLRSVNPGSPEWIETIERLADRIDETLSSFIANPEPVSQGSKTTMSMQETASPGTLERMAALEDKVPGVVADMEQIAFLMSSLNDTVVAATPKFTQAKSFNERLAASRNLAMKLDPIADEMSDTAERLVSNFSEWDIFAQVILEHVRGGGDLSDPDFSRALGGFWSLAKTGTDPLSPVKEFVQQITQVIGISRDLDRPLMAIRDAGMRIVDMIGILDGWRQGLEALEGEYLETGFLDSLPKYSDEDSKD